MRKLLFLLLLISSLSYGQSVNLGPNSSNVKGVLDLSHGGVGSTLNSLGHCNNVNQAIQWTGSAFTCVTIGGGVTSVGITVPAFMTASNSPITTSGNISLAFGLQSANYFLASPSGASGVPTFRQLTSLDISAIGILSNNISGTSSNITGILSVANGGLNTSTAPSIGQLLIASSSSVYTPQTLSGDCSISSTGVLICTKTSGVAFAASATTDTTNATNITTGTLAVAQTAALTGDVSKSAGSGTVSVIKVNGASLPTSSAYVGTDSSGKIITATSPVTSVGLSLPTFLTVSGSPITSSGSFNVTLTSQTSNYVFAAPNGSTGAPVFRALVPADIPTLNQNTTGNAATSTLAANATSLAGGSIGSVPYQSGSGVTTFLAPGTSGYVLTSQGAGSAPVWAAAGSGGSQINSDWNAVSGVAQILNKPVLAASATTDTTNATNITSGVLANARINWAAPSGIGSTTPSTGAFTTLTATSGTFTTLSATGQITHNAAGTASTPTLIETGALYTSGTASTNFPLWYINQGATAPTTWNANGTEFAINAASGFNGAFFSTHINGGSPLIEMWADGSIRWGVSGASWVNGTTGYIVSNKVFNSMIGFQVNGLAPTGNYLRGNGTNFVASALVLSDITALGTLSNATSGNAATSTSLAGGTIGAIPYQSAASTTAFLSAGTSGYVLTANGAGVAPSWQAASGGTNFSAETVTYSATPTYSATKTLSRITLTGNITGGTLPIGTIDGFQHCFDFVQGSGSYVVSYPSNVIGGDAIGTANGGHNQQCFTANVASGNYYAMDRMRKDALTIVVASPSSGTVGTAYSQSVGISGGVSPYTCNLLSGSVAGLTQTGCTLAGTPSAAGSNTLVEQITDAVGNTTIQSITIVINSSTGSTNGPVINYTDVNVASASGGDDGSGAYVTIFGSGFGASKGASTLTMNSGAMNTSCTNCSWSDKKIVAKIGSGTTGNIVATVGGNPSNGMAFTVAATNYYFVTTTGNDSTCAVNNYALPCATWRKAFNLATGNDNVNVTTNTIIYFGNGVSQTTDDGRGYSATMSTDLGGSSSTAQLNLIAMPGATVNVGSTSVQNGIKGWGKYITISGLTIIGQNSAVDIEAGPSRLINNDMSCPSVPSGLGGTACWMAETTTTTDTWQAYGNVLHDTGGASVDKTYHAVYFSDNTNHVDFAYNKIGGGTFKGYCRAVMSHATTGNDLYDLHFHDNVIQNSWCDGLALATSNPNDPGATTSAFPWFANGGVEAYNNVIYNVGLASNPVGVANHTGIAVNTDPRSLTLTGTVQVYNNSIYNAGAFTTGASNGCFGVPYDNVVMNLTNNICQQPSSSQPYIEPTNTSMITGSTNTWYGAGTKPSFDTAGININPLFTSTSTPDFSLQSGSPSKATGTITGSHYSVFDIVNTPRGSTPSMGAYQ